MKGQGIPAVGVGGGGKGGRGWEGWGAGLEGGKEGDSHENLLMGPVGEAARGPEQSGT